MKPNYININYKYNGIQLTLYTISSYLGDFVVSSWQKYNIKINPKHAWLKPLSTIAISKKYWEFMENNVAFNWFSSYHNLSSIIFFIATITIPKLFLTVVIILYPAYYYKIWHKFHRDLLWFAISLCRYLKLQLIKDSNGYLQIHIAEKRLIS